MIIRIVDVVHGYCYIECEISMATFSWYSTMWLYNYVYQIWHKMHHEFYIAPGIGVVSSLNATGNNLHYNVIMFIIAHATDSIGYNVTDSVNLMITVCALAAPVWKIIILILPRVTP